MLIVRAPWASLPILGTGCLGQGPAGSVMVYPCPCFPDPSGALWDFILAGEDIAPASPSPNGLDPLPPGSCPDISNPDTKLFSRSGITSSRGKIFSALGMWEEFGVVPFWPVSPGLLSVLRSSRSLDLGGMCREAWQPGSIPDFFLWQLPSSPILDFFHQYQPGK